MTTTTATPAAAAFTTRDNFFYYALFVLWKQPVTGHYVTELFLSVSLCLSF